MTTASKVAELLSPFTEPEDDLASRRLQVDREKIVSRMVEVSLATQAPEQRFGSRARVVAALALAAGFALAAWGGARLWRQGTPTAGAGIEVVALRGRVTGVQGAEASGLRVGAPTQLRSEGTLETSQGAQARIRTSAGMEIDLLENTKVSLAELGATRVSAALRLDHGRVRCVIPHQPGRTFTVVTAAARVIDVGTIFSVSVEQTVTGPKTVVHVEDGEVLVQYPGGQSRLTASQSWVSGSEPSKPVAEVAPADVAVEELPAMQSPRRDLVKRRPDTLATEAALLRSGLASERKGELGAAVTAFETLVKRYPDSQLAPDAQAALARVKGRLESSK